MPTLLKGHIYRNTMQEKYRRCIATIMPVEDRDVPEYVAREFKEVADDMSVLRNESEND